MYGQDSMENLSFDKENYFHVLVFYVLFHTRNKEQFFSYGGNLEELEKHGNTRTASSYF